MVACAQNRTIVADRPAALPVAGRRYSVKQSLGAARLGLPGVAAIARAQDGAMVADRPAALPVAGQREAVQLGTRCRWLQEAIPFDRRSQPLSAGWPGLGRERVRCRPGNTRYPPEHE